ncbi:hypothetical protein SAMN05428934_11038 [Tessaracoccus flavus]|nr:hypothetical protein SAMN05428934_11038 [Tessaracoccus flavus]
MQWAHNTKNVDIERVYEFIRLYGIVLYEHPF